MYYRKDHDTYDHFAVVVSVEDVETPALAEQTANEQRQTDQKCCRIELKISNEMTSVNARDNGQDGKSVFIMCVFRVVCKCLQLASLRKCTNIRR